MITGRSVSLFLLSVILLVGALDIYLIARGEVSVSEYISESARQYPMIAVLAGMLVAHLFWPVWRVD